MTLLALTACSSGGQAGSSAGQDGDAAAEGGQFVSSTPIGEFDPEGTFSWGYTIGASSMDPHRGTSGFDQNWLFPAYDRLVYMSPEGKPEPMLATEWELTEDGSAIEMQLREDVVFHDGTPMDAEAVKLSLDRARGPESTVASLLEKIDSVDVTGPHSIDINLNGPAAALIPTLGDRAGMIISPEALDNPDLDRMPVGAGAYEVSEYRQGDRVIYDRFEDYWDPEVQRVAQMQFRIMADDETRFNAIRAGEVDIGIVRESQIPQALELGLNILDGPRPSYYSFSVNTDMEPFDNPLVRRALWKSINREIIGNGILEGYCEPQIQLWPTNSWAYDEDFGSGIDEGQYGEHDPELARDLLAEAGLPDGFSFEAIVPNITGYVSITEAIQAQLAEVGIQMSIRQVEAAQARAIFSVEKSVPASMGSFEPTTDPSGPLTTSIVRDALGNPGGLTSPKLEQLYVEQATVLTPEERAPIFHQITEELTNIDPHSTPICMRRRQEVFQPGLQGLEIYPTGARAYRGVAVPAE